MIQTRYTKDIATEEGTSSIVTEQVYDSEKNEEKIIYSTGAYKINHYDEFERLEYVECYSASTSTTDSSVTLYTSYNYDGSDNITAMIDYTVEDGEKIPLRHTGYEYDMLGRVTAYYEIDDTTAPTDAQKIESKISYIYDENGNETSKVDSITGESVEYKYDEENRLIYVSGKKSDGTSYTQENRYSGSGQRIYKKDTEIADTTTVEVTKYYYQNGMVVYTTDESGALKTYNYYGVDNNIISSTRYDSDSVSYYVYNKDIQGSTTTIVDSDGKSCL